ncbi:helical backbone metal receptor [Caldimonas brevitalea]|uniref:Metal ABC transporter substrate-binding protein n=1 Tax=Caldimonas brevitalea TaxID=413882 RepID=A0A0G3C0C3_9BURK|nr:helical backbone metal receptor [Caldimonas brevitalea]AKJ32230.1 metal ABC transporter substrate-binding protein [Caldimonas brevitalea]
MTLRIASLVPSVTELLADLGLAPWLVARTGFCVHPLSLLTQVPKVGGTKDVQVDKLRRLAPTHVVVNVDENTRETVDALRQFVPHVVVTHPCGPQDNFALYRQMADVFGAVDGVAERAHRVARDLEAELQATAAGPRRRVLYCIWRDPWMTVARDTYISRMLALIGWLTAPHVEGGLCGAARYPSFEWSEGWLAEVDEVLLSSEPYRFQAAHEDEVRRLLALHGLRAGVRRVDGERLSWYGSRAVAGVRYLRELARRAD